MRLFFALLDEKHNFSESFEKIFENFIRIFLKMHYFSIFFQKVNKPCVNFLRVWTKNANCWETFEKFLKNFDENSIENLNFFHFIYNFIFRKFVTKNRALGNNTSFLRQFFRFRGGGVSPFPPD